MKIAVLLSGGVDSSTALFRLAEEGYTEITAYYLKIWLEDDTAYLGDCPWEEDLRFAQAVCDQAGVELRVVPLQLEYYDKVVEYALAELRLGRTPSPDIFCNQRVKFGAFFGKLSAFEPELGGDWKVASGHYAQVDWVAEAFPGARRAAGLAEPESLPPLDPRAGKGAGRWRLLRSPDPVKDQSYFLSHLSQEQLSRILFPIGALHKPQVRELAQRHGLASQDRPDSQGICFLGKIRYPDFVRHYLGVQPGPIVERESGRTLGEHQGFWFHTMGQRSGLGLSGGPWYVSAKDCARNVVYASHGTQGQETERQGFKVAGVHWLAGRPPTEAELAGWNDETGSAQALCLKLRHGPALIPCRLAWSGPDCLAVAMDRPDRGIAAGQFAVFYRGGECLGSGKIQEPEQDELEAHWARHQAWQAAEDERAAAQLAARRAKQAERRKRWQGGKP